MATILPRLEHKGVCPYLEPGLQNRRGAWAGEELLVSVLAVRIPGGACPLLLWLLQSPAPLQRALTSCISAKGSVAEACSDPHLRPGSEPRSVQLSAGLVGSSRETEPTRHQSEELPSGHLQLWRFPSPKLHPLQMEPGKAVILLSPRGEAQTQELWCLRQGGGRPGCRREVTLLHLFHRLQPSADWRVGASRMRWPS